MLDTNQPPRNYVVVIGDLSAKGNFQEVEAAMPDTPPPLQDENNSQRY